MQTSHNAKNYFLPAVLFSVVSLAFIGLHSQDPKDLLTKKSENIYQLKEIEINTLLKTITFPCMINMDSGLIEVVLCSPEGKTHESLLTTKISPLELQTALLLLGLDPVNEIPEDGKSDPLSPYLSVETPGDSVLLFIELERNGKSIRKPVDYYIRNERTQKQLRESNWLFRGAVTHNSGHVIIDPDVTMIATYHDPVALMELNSADKYDDELFYINTQSGLKKQEKAKLIIQAFKK